MSDARKPILARAQALATGPSARRLGGFLLRKGLPVFLGLVAALGVFNVAVMPRFVGHGREVKMPDVRGKSRAEAEKILAGFSLSVRDTVVRVAHDLDRGAVIDQEPFPGAILKPDRGVRLVLSSGREALKVPRLAGQSLRFVRINLGEEGYRMGDVVRAPSSAVGRDFVIATDPPAGAPIESGQRIHLLVSDGAERRSWIMPDLRGEDLRLTADRLRFAGFNVVVEGEDPYDIRSRRVISTDPRPGDPIPGGGTIRLIGG